jgi:hypothetical protein
MASGDREIMLDKKVLEGWLSEALIPVEPSARFLRRLRARLVTYHGGRPFSGWMIVVFLATVLLLAVTLIGFLLKLASGWIGLVGGLGRKKRENGEPQSIPVIEDLELMNVETSQSPIRTAR